MTISKKFQGRPAAFTLLELLLGMTIAAIALAGLATATISLQRSFGAANYQMTAQNDQLRVLDYLSRDLRTATAVTISDAGGRLSATLPASDPNVINLQLGTALTSVLGGQLNTANPQTVSYYVEGGELIRNLNGVETDLADTVASLSFSRQEQFLTTSILFTPEFSNSPTTATQPNTRATSCTYLRTAVPVN